MNIDWARVVPVLVSIGIIIAVAVLRTYSKTIAAIAATMPLNIPLGLWLVYSGSGNSQQELADFTKAVAINLLPTLAFVVVAWQMTRAGYTLVPTLIAGYAIWAIGLVILLVVQAQLGR